MRGDAAAGAMRIKDKSNGQDVMPTITRDHERAGPRSVGDTACFPVRNDLQEFAHA
jgi:hypothetical protein